VVVKLRRRFLVLATVLATVVAMVGVSAPVAAASGTTSDIHVIWKLVGGTVAMKTDGGTVATTNDIDCADTGTCILCTVLAYPPYPGSAPIINFQGEVHCYYPNQGYAPATVGNITLQVGLWDYVYDTFMGTLIHPALTQPPYSQPWVSQLGLTGAMSTIPASNCGSRAAATVVFVNVLFGQCCPTDAGGAFLSDIRSISC
jgi:hypothetical protein